MAREEEQVVRFDGLFEAKAEALRTALLEAVQHLEPVLLAPAPDEEALRRVGEWVHALADDADAQLLVIALLRADEDLIAEVERMFDSLRGLEERIAAALKLGGR